ncbi:MAG TPA: hypothetical protein VG387_03635 [Rhizomicrobium sp.]|jgi:hypothetical protein|nr:hypothetical protein [Rhizomicrobium sp.]
MGNSPHAAQHVALIFIGVFGFAAMWFSGVIISTRRDAQRPLDGTSWYLQRMHNRLRAVPIGLAIAAFIGLIVWLWQ